MKGAGVGRGSSIKSGYTHPTRTNSLTQEHSEKFMNDMASHAGGISNKPAVKNKSYNKQFERQQVENSSSPGIVNDSNKNFDNNLNENIKCNNPKMAQVMNRPAEVKIDMTDIVSDANDEAHEKAVSLNANQSNISEVDDPIMFPLKVFIYFYYFLSYQKG